jgi:hypothetical protein
MKAPIAASILFLCLSACGKLNFDPQPEVEEGFSPKSISGLSFWLRADQGVTISPGTLDEVTDWVDAASGATTFSTPIGAGSIAPPVFNPSDTNFGGRPTIRFGVTTPLVYRHLEVSSANMSVLCDGTYSFFAVMKPDMIIDGSNAFWYLSFTSGGTTLARSFASFSAAAPSGHNFGFNLTDFQSVSKLVYTFNSSLAKFPSGVVAVGASFNQSATATLFRDGSSSVQSSATPVTYTGACPTVLARVGFMTDVTGGLFNSTLDIAELMIYDWPLGAAELNALGCYAKNKYGISTYSGTCN